MHRKNIFVLIAVLAFSVLTSFAPTDDGLITSYTVDPKTRTLSIFWKDSRGEKLKSLSRLKAHLDSTGRKLLFAMNCGMYTPENAPVGLYIENGKKLSSMKTCNNRKANFCLQPQGVFFVTKDRKAGISTVAAFSYQNVEYAIEAAPMIVINSKENTSLPKLSKVIRNGAGIRKDGKVVLAISNRPVSFPELAQYFISQGCTTAIYFDGGVSKAMLWDNTIVPVGRKSRGGLGAMIAVVQ